MPSYRSLAGVLARHAEDPHREWARLGRSMVINVALGNTDAHARNHAFLIDRGTVRLAPMYDVAPTAEFTSTRRLALWVDGQAMLMAVTPGHLAREMASWGIRPADAQIIVDDALERLTAALPTAADVVPVVRDDIVKAVERRTRELRQSDRQ
jgi:serine/threonine-protein kinase HipA